MVEVECSDVLTGLRFTIPTSCRNRSGCESVRGETEHPGTGYVSRLSDVSVGQGSSG